MYREAKSDEKNELIYIVLLDIQEKKTKFGLKARSRITMSIKF